MCKLLTILFWAPAFTSTGRNAQRAACGKMAERRKAAQAFSLGGAEFSCSPNKPSRTNTAQVFQSHFHQPLLEAYGGLGACTSTLP